MLITYTHITIKLKIITFNDFISIFKTRKGEAYKTSSMLNAYKQNKNNLSYFKNTKCFHVIITVRKYKQILLKVILKCFLE